MAAKKKTLYRKNDALDVIDIPKSAFEVFLVFVIILFLRVLHLNIRLRS